MKDPLERKPSKPICVVMVFHCFPLLCSLFQRSAGQPDGCTHVVTPPSGKLVLNVSAPMTKRSTKPDRSCKDQQDKKSRRTCPIAADGDSIHRVCTCLQTQPLSPRSTDYRPDIRLFPRAHSASDGACPAVDAQTLTPLLRSAHSAIPANNVGLP